MKNITYLFIISISFVFSMISSCTNYDPWLKFGFTPQKADSWIELKFTAPEAAHWDEQGFTPAESLKWKAKGFSAQESGDFQQRGFELRGAGLWKTEGFSASEAQQWGKNGYTAQQAKSWKRAGFDARTSKQWEEKGYDYKSAQAWKLAGFNLDKANHWKSQGYSLKEAKNYIEWQRENFSIKEADEWMVVEPDVHKAKQWREFGLSTTQVNKAKKHGLTVSEYAQWQAMGFGLEKLLEVKQKGLSVSEVKKWTQAGLSIEQVIRAKASGFKLGKASAWKKEGYSIEQAIDAKSQGLTLESIQKGHRLTKLVISKGVGATEKEAVVDAGRSAVEKTVGFYIKSETIVQNNKLIKDEVLTYSSGFVEGFEMLNSQKDEDGLFQVTASVRVAFKRLQTKLGNLNLKMKDVGSVSFKAVEYDKFSASRQFRKIFSKIVIDPLKKSDVYEINLLSFQPYSQNISIIKSKTKWLNNDKERASIGNLMPYIISFEIKLLPIYLNSLLEFFEASSEENITTLPYTPGNHNLITCGKIKNECLDLKKGMDYWLRNNSENCVNDPRMCGDHKKMLAAPICKVGGREFKGVWILMGETNSYKRMAPFGSHVWPLPPAIRPETLTDVSYWGKIKQTNVRWSNPSGDVGESEIESTYLEAGRGGGGAWIRPRYYRNKKSFRFSEINGSILFSLLKREINHYNHLKLKLDLVSNKIEKVWKEGEGTVEENEIIKSRTFGWQMEAASWRGGKNDTLSTTMILPSLNHQNTTLLGNFDPGGNGFTFMNGFNPGKNPDSSGCLGNSVAYMFYENKWQLSIIMWLDEHDIEKLSEIKIRPILKNVEM